jgi:hypothetical protein
MKSLRRRLRQAVLAVPVATTACLGGGPGAPATTTSSSGSVTTYSGATASGSSSGTGTTGGTGSSSSSGGSTGSMAPECPSFGLCDSDCECTTAVFQVAPLSSELPTDGGELGFCWCVEGCPQLPDGGRGASDLSGCTATVSAAPAADGGPLWDLACYYNTSCAGGRRPEGWCETPPRARSELGAHFAHLAQLEAASVAAFRRLARELRDLGAPGALVARARRAAREEVRHARLTRGLAARFGGEVPPVRVEPTAARSLEDFALENVREGCVGETYGAALAGWQALHAADGEVRAVAEALRDDEEGHAELAWDIQAWAEARLSAEARARVHAAQEEAIRGLERGAASPGEEASRLGGLPTVEQQGRLLGALRVEVWGWGHRTNRRQLLYVSAT